MRVSTMTISNNFKGGISARVKINDVHYEAVMNFSTYNALVLASQPVFALLCCTGQKHVYIFLLIFP